MVDYLSMCLGSNIKKWSFGLSVNSIGSWEGLKRLFVCNFGMIYEQEKATYDLKQIMQKEDETLCSYIKRYHDVKANVSSMHEEIVVYIFRKGLRNQELS